MTWQVVEPKGEQGLGVWEVRAPNRPAAVAQLVRLMYAHRYGIDPGVSIAFFRGSSEGDIDSWSFTTANAAPDDAQSGGSSVATGMVVFLWDPDGELPAYAQVCFAPESPTRLYIKSVELDPDVELTRKLARDTFIHNNDPSGEPELAVGVRPDGYRDANGYAIRVLRCGRYMVAQCIVEDDWEVPDFHPTPTQPTAGYIYSPSTLSDYASMFIKAPATWFVAPIDTRSAALGEAAFGLRDLFASTYVSGSLRGFAYNFAWTFHDPAQLAYITLRIGAWVAELLGKDRVGRLWEEFPFPSSFRDFLEILKEYFTRVADAVNDYIERLMNSGVLYIRVTAHLSTVTVQITPQEES